MMKNYLFIGGPAHKTEKFVLGEDTQMYVLVEDNTKTTYHKWTINCSNGPLEIFVDRNIDLIKFLSRVKGGLSGPNNISSR